MTRFKFDCSLKRVEIPSYAAEHSTLEGQTGRPNIS